jgi:hypothetical protein
MPCAVRAAGGEQSWSCMLRGACGDGAERPPRGRCAACTHVVCRRRTHAQFINLSPRGRQCVACTVRARVQHGAARFYLYSGRHCPRPRPCAHLCLAITRPFVGARRQRKEAHATSLRPRCQPPLARAHYDGAALRVNCCACCAKHRAAAGGIHASGAPQARMSRVGGGRRRRERVTDRRGLAAAPARCVGCCGTGVLVFMAARAPSRPELRRTGVRHRNACSVLCAWRRFRAAVAASRCARALR